MNIAICISGHLRNYKELYPAFKKFFIDQLLDLGNVDIFVHTWSTLGPHKSFKVNVLGDVENFANQETQIHEIFETYHPKLIEIENYELIKEQFLLSNYCDRNCSDLRIFSDGILHSTPMFYKIFLCNNLKTNIEKQYNIMYDVVFRFRPDLLWEQPFNLKQYDLNCLNLHYHNDIYNDMFAFGNSKIIDQYSNLFLNLKPILEANYDFGPEHSLGIHIKNLKIPTKNLDFVLKHRAFMANSSDLSKNEKK